MARFMDVHNRFVGVTAEQLRKVYEPERMSSAEYWLSFARIINVPFESCVATLESWQRTGPDGGLRIGQSLLRWPIEHDRRYGTCRIEVGLARGPLRPSLRMRLDIDPWSTSFSRTALELIPDQPIRPTAAYFRSGHLLMDSLTHSLLQHLPPQRLGCVTATQSHGHQDARGRSGRAKSLEPSPPKVSSPRVHHAALRASASSIATYSVRALAVMNRALPSLTECRRPDRIRS